MESRTRRKHCLVVAGFMLAATAAGASDQVLLAKVLERQFLYNIGLSSPGTLGVGQVHYRLEVVDSWGADGTTEVVQVLADGACLNLLQEQARYLVVVTDQVTQFRQEPVRFIDCKATPEAEAGEAIASLNAERLQRPL